MRYVDQHLNPGETVVHRTRLHPIIFLGGAGFGVLALFMASLGGMAAVGGTFLVIAVLVLVLGARWLRYANSEFAVTTSRVVIKVGWLNTRTVELQLAKVETIVVEQDWLGRLFDFGAIVVVGTGGTREPFDTIRAPLVFRQWVQWQADQQSSARAPVAGAEVPAPSPEARAERECPSCAERILAKASRCRFCGQAVTPTG